MITPDGSTRGSVELVLTSSAEADNLADFVERRAGVSSGVERGRDREIEPERVLLVAFALSPDDALDVVRTAREEPPDEIGIVGVGETRRSASTGSIGDTAPDGITTVARPDDLSRLATVIGVYLRSWEDGATRVCVASLTRLFAHSDAPAVIRFLHVVAAHVRSTGAAGRFYLDPETPDGPPIETLALLFDGVTDPEGRIELADVGAASAVDEALSEVLNDERPRHALRHLLDCDGPVTIRDLAAHVADDDAAVDRVHQLLHHVYLPRLAEAGLVITDDDQTVVEVTDATDRIEALLTGDDSRSPGSS